MRKRILIAEDEPHTKEMMAEMATRHGYDVVAVTDGVELLEVAAKEKFDVIITDLRMPNLNGASAAEIMKMQGNLVHMIALTALNPQDTSLVQGKFAKIFYKPCDVRKLFAYIDSLP